MAGCAPAATYPHSPQWRGGHFENPPEWPERPGFAELWRWRHERHSTGFVDYHPPRVVNDGARLRKNRQTPSVTWIGHATVLLQGGGIAVLTDPNFSDQPFFERHAAPGVAL